MTDTRRAARLRWLGVSLLAVGVAAGAFVATARHPDAAALPAALSSATPRTVVAPASDPGAGFEEGKVMRRALGSDPRQHYYYYVPPGLAKGAPLFVTVHGISRNVEEHATLFAPYARKHGVVLVAPLFTKERNDGYQRLEPDASGRSADATLDAIVAEVATRTGASPRKLYLFGFSGGAQFAHRYTLAHPERVKRAVVGAPGWFTFPDRTKPYPYGIGPSSDRRALRFDPDRFLRVPVTVLVGGADVGDESLRRNSQVDAQQGVTRLARAQKWVASMNRAAKRRGLPEVFRFERVPGIDHSFKRFMEEGDLGARVFETMFPSTRARRIES
jgi:pimeloyl-ACP methyl ester carboxylesterase